MSEEDKAVHEYAFDITLNACVRVKARDRHMAADCLEEVIDCLDMSDFAIDGYNEAKGIDGVQLTEVSLGAGEPNLFELDGEYVEGKEFCRGCDAPYESAGDGYDGLCPPCADKAYPPEC